MVGCVGGAEGAVLAAEFGGCEGLETVDACADLCEERGVGGEDVERVLGVVLLFAGDEEEVDAGGMLVVFV